MTWLSLALLGAASHSLIVVADKIVVERYLRDGWSFPFFTSLWMGVYAAALLVLRLFSGQLQLPPPGILIVALMPGLLHYISALFYTRALLRTDASTLSALNQITPLYALAWGWIVFGDTLTQLSFVGLLVVIVSCAALSAERVSSTRRFRLNSALWLVVAGAFLRSLSDLAIKFTVGEQDYWNTFALSRAILLPLSLLALVHRPYRRMITQSVQRNGPWLVPGIALLEAVVILPVMLAISAYANGPLGLVSAAVNTTPLFILLITLLANTLRPGLVPDQAGARSLTFRAGLTASTLIGVTLLRA